MERITDLEYLRLSKSKRALYKVGQFFKGIPGWFVNLGKSIWGAIKGAGNKVADEFVDVYQTFKDGDWKTRVSYVVMGFGSIARGQVLRGLIFLILEIVFIVYMIVFGGGMLAKIGTLGTNAQQEIYDPVTDSYVIVEGDNSFKILLYSVLTLFFIVAFIYTWRLNVKQNKIAQQILATGKPLKSGKDDMKSLLDDQFHKSLLALPTIGITIFTVLPIVFMILVAFTNYDGNHNGTANLFTWVGWENFNYMLNWGSSTGNISATFGEILLWTLIWAFFATFSNYFLGLVVAMLINKKGIKLKKVWRTILVLTIAIPQFISLLYISKLFDYSGVINGWIVSAGGEAIHFIDNQAEPWVARLTVIIINIWIGIPYLMLMATGILMNIPEDLYESSKIDGANAFQQFGKITMPYMLFITGPYLLTSFTGNMNNFNVIYLLTGGAPAMKDLPAGIDAGNTDLLVTWLYKITMGSGNKYYLASVLGILIFVIVAVISAIIYNVLPSNKNEEDFQ